MSLKSFPVQEDRHLLTVARYVEANATRAGIVDDVAGEEKRITLNGTSRSSNTLLFLTLRDVS
jgi:hypothetical protein